MMASIRAFLFRILHLHRRPRSEATLDDELQFHLQMEIDCNVRLGMSEAEARRRALISLGGVEQTREACRDARAIRWAAEFWQDLRYGWRVLRTSPRFTAVAALTLALGVGANAAIFSAVNAILLRPLPYADSARLVTIRRVQRAHYVTPEELRQIRQGCPALGRIVTYHTGRLLMTGGTGPREVTAARVSSDFFPMLGVRPLLGRFILPEDTQPGNDRVVVLNFRLWMDEFGGDTGIVGRDIPVGDQRYTVIGVMSQEFGALNWSYRSEGMWLPQIPLPPGAQDPDVGSIIARLKRDATLAAANAQIKPLSARFAATHRHPREPGLVLRAWSLDLGIDPRVRVGLLILLGAVGFVLLMASVNVTSLLVARSWTRQREFAIRKALGASRPRLLRQLLTESLLLALISGALGLFLSYWGIQLLRVLAPPYAPRVDRIVLDGHVLWFTAGTSLLVAVLVGLPPALQASSRRTDDGLKAGAGGFFGGFTTRRPHRLRSALVVLEVLLAVVLVVGAALMGRSFYRLMSVNTGVSANNVLMMNVRFSQGVCSQQRWSTTCPMAAAAVLDGIRALPGVRRTALSEGGPFSGGEATGHYEGSGRSGLYIEGLGGDQLRGDQWIYGRLVSPGFFSTLGIRLVSGRDFEPGDSTARAAIVSEGFARKYLPGNPIGKRFSTNGDRPDSWMKVAGVVNDVRNRAVGGPPGEVYYMPFVFNHNEGFTVVTQASADPLPLVPAMLRAVRAVDKDALVTRIETVEQALANSAAEPRFQTALVGSFGVIALLLAFIGVYGVISYSVVQRTHEIGVRTALGAERQDVLRMILREGMVLTTTGIGIGMAGAWGLTRVLRSVLFEIEPTDPPTFLGVAAALAVVTLAACYLPARRAVKVDPILALRHE
jgi:putative ABC transport system permease protein